MPTNPEDSNQYSWQTATRVTNMPDDDGDNNNNNNNIGNTQHADTPRETWSITNRDAPLSSETAIRVMDHAHVVLSKRLVIDDSDLLITDEGQTPSGEQHSSQQQQQPALDIFRFETSLARFLNSEIDLGKRIAFGNFADIFAIRKFQDSKSVKACTPEQIQAAEDVKSTYRPEDLVIKLLRPTLLSNSGLYATGAADILTEGFLLATINHPHIVQIRGRSIPSVEGFASGKRDSFFLVLERLEGNLLDRLSQWQERANKNRFVRNGIKGKRQNSAALLKERVEVMAQLADAMTYLHSKNIIHRDLKLSNIGLDHYGNVKLIDFGLAKILPPHNREKDTFQMTGNTGSVRYMAPEIARGDRYNLKADVYSFAILLHEVLNLAKTWHGMKPNEIHEKVIVRKQRPTVSMFWPATLRDLLKSTWSDIPGARLSMIHVHSVLSKQLHLMEAAAEATAGESLQQLQQNSQES